MNNTNIPLPFSAIIPVKDQPEQLARLLDSLESNVSEQYLPEIIVVDDASNKDIASIACRYKRVRYFLLEEGRGPAAARNLGAEKAHSSLLFFLDADVVCPPGLFEKAAVLLTEYPECAAVSFLNQVFDPTSGDIENYHVIIENYWFSAVLDTSSDIGFIEGFMTRGGALRKQAFQQIHGFDTQYKTNAHEDYDFGKRLSAQYPLLITGTPRIYHNYPKSFLRLLRNVWVRTRLFIPYYLAHRPRLDKAQLSSKEALLRILGVGSGGLACAMVLPVPFRSLGILLAVAGLFGYGCAINALLKRAWTESGRFGFMLKFLIIHYISSIVIVASACLTLASLPFSSSSHKLLSPIRSANSDKPR